MSHTWTPTWVQHLHFKPALSTLPISPISQVILDLPCLSNLLYPDKSYQFINSPSQTFLFHSTLCLCWSFQHCCASRSLCCPWTLVAALQWDFLPLLQPSSVHPPYFSLGNFLNSITSLNRNFRPLSPTTRVMLLEARTRIFGELIRSQDVSVSPGPPGQNLKQEDPDSFWFNKLLRRNCFLDHFLWVPQAKSVFYIWFFFFFICW